MGSRCCYLSDAWGRISFVHSGIYASGGLVNIEWNIRQWRIGLYRVEYIPVADWFIHSGIYASGGLVYIEWYIRQ